MSARRAAAAWPQAARFAAALVGLAGGGPGPPAGPAAAEPFYHRGSLDSLGAPPRRVRLPDTTKKFQQLLNAKAPTHLPRPPVKVHPRVRHLVNTRPPSERVRLIVTFRDTLFTRSGAPALRPFAGKGLADTLRRRRQPAYDRIIGELAQSDSVTTLRTFWNVHAILVRMPLGRVDSLARRRDIIRIEPAHGGRPPQVVDPPSAYCRVYRGPYIADEIGLTRFRSAGLAGGHVGLIDSGARGTHALLQDSGRLRDARDCLHDGCPREESHRDRDTNPGHGTSTAALLMGQSDRMPDFTGLTEATVDCFNVYPEGGGRDLEATIPAVIDAMGRMVDRAPEEGAPYDLAVVEVAVPGDDSDVGVLAEAVEKLFLVGIPVIVANGNDGDSLTSPANAPDAIAVGAYYAKGGDNPPDWVWGRTNDGRVKPDLTGPTMICTAVNHATGQEADVAISEFSGTSGATPVAGAATLVLRNYMRGLVAGAQDGGVADDEVAAGNVYAALLLLADAGEREREGFGRVRLPDEGILLWGRDSLEQGQLRDVSFDPGIAGTVRVDAGIWWSRSGETSTRLPTRQSRSDIDLWLMGPGGVLATAQDIDPVFERLGAVGPGDEPWTVRMWAATAPLGMQVVYWAAWVRPED